MLRHFFFDLPKDSMILAVGAGSGWLVRHLKKAGWHQYFSLDIILPAGLLGDIIAFTAMDITPESFDVIVAFEFVEHIDAYLVTPSSRLEEGSFWLRLFPI